MKRRASFVIGLLSVILFVCRASPAQVGGSTIVLARGEGLLGAMQQNGCDPTQLITVMQLNNITPERLARLPVNLQIRLPVECSTAASSVNAHLSANIIHDESVRVNQVATVVAVKEKDGVIVSLKNAVSILRAQIADLDATIVDLRSQLTQATRKAGRVIYAPSPEQKFEWIVIGILLGVLGALIYYWKLEPKPVIQYVGDPEEIAYAQNGKTVLCNKLSDSKYGCPLCSAPISKAGLNGHMEGEHYMHFRFEQDEVRIIPPALQPEP